MCFLKTLKPLDTIPIEKGHLPFPRLPQEKFLNTNESDAFSKILQPPQISISLSKQDQLLLSLFNLVSCNTQLLRNIDEKLTYNDQTIKGCFDELGAMVNQSSSLNQDSQLTDSIRDPCFYEEEADSCSLTQTLFGKKRYQYKIQLQGEIPATIYKERNISLSVILKNKQNQKVLNSNIIHLCLGVCDAEGEWVTENKAKENFMKGKTQVEMYHGEGSFLKIYPREVSRAYAGGKLNFVVYAKPSMLKFTNNSSAMESIIDSRLIEPLVIKDISIKAKKKQ